MSKKIGMPDEDRKESNTGIFKRYRISLFGLSLLPKTENETLWNIAEKAYGQLTKWPLTFEVNPDLTKDLNLIDPNTKHRIPRLVPRLECSFSATYLLPTHN